MEVSELETKYLALVIYEDKQHVRLDFSSSVFDSACYSDFGGRSDVNMIFRLEE